MLQTAIILVIATQTMTAHNGFPGKACYQGWTFYQNICYKTYQEPKTWEQAGRHCKTLSGGSLAHFSDEHQQNNVTRMLSNPPNSLYWIGLHNRVSRWIWEDNSVPNYQMFLSTARLAEPGCAVLQGAQWDRRCCDDKHGYICRSKTFDCTTDGWFLSTSHHCVKAVSAINKLTWPAARGYCKQNRSADLATFSNISEVHSLGLSGDLWVGLEFIAVEMRFVWVGGNRDYSRVPTPTISSHGVHAVSCGGVRINGTKKPHASRFHDNCSRELNFICEKALCVTEPGVFACRDGQCVDSKQECDGVPHCRDGSDESNCAKLEIKETTGSSTSASYLDLLIYVSDGKPFTKLYDKRDDFLFILSNIPECPAYGVYVSQLIPYARAWSLYGDFISGANGTVYACKRPASTPMSLPNGMAVSSDYPHDLYNDNYTTGTVTTPHRQSTFFDSSTREITTPNQIITSLSSMSNALSTKGQAITPIVETTSSVLLHGHGVSTVTSKASNDSTTEPFTSTTDNSLRTEVLTTGDPMSTTKSDVTATSKQGEVTLVTNSLTSSTLEVDTRVSSFSDTMFTDCWTEPNDAMQYSCIWTHLSLENSSLCDNIDDNGTIEFEHTFNSLTLASSIQFLLNTIDVVLSKMKTTSGDSCIDKGLSHFDAIKLKMLQNPNIKENGIFNGSKHGVDYFLENVTFDKLANFAYSHRDATVTNLAVNQAHTKGPSFFLSIVLLSIPQTGNLKFQRSITGEIDVMNIFLFSRVLSINAFTAAAEYSLSLAYTLRHTQDKATILNDDINKSTEIICGFMDFKTGLWSDRGCMLLFTNTTMSKCHCNHTTNFAILMQVKDVKITQLDDTILNIITYIGCSISLMTQLITITVFICVRSLNSERVYVHRNLCFAIIAAQVAFLSGIKAVQYEVLCSIVALILHYFYTAVFVWMLVEGLHLYSKVVQVFGTERSRVIYYSGFGWGVPLVLVTISASSDWEGYGTSKSCWLSIKKGTIWAFVGPAISIIIVNMVILCMVIKIIMSSAKLDRNSEYDHIRAGVKGAVFLLPLLGLTWVFGLLAVNEDLVIFQYLFAIFNSLQGFFIFLFHCVFNTEVRQALTRMREKRLLQKGEFLSLSTTSSASRSRDHILENPPSHYRDRKHDIQCSWSEDTTDMSSGSGTRSTDLKVQDDVVVEDLTEDKNGGTLAYV